jgi:hypothetical protein
MMAAAVWPLHRAGHARLKIQRTFPGNGSAILSSAANGTPQPYRLRKLLGVCQRNPNTAINVLIGPKHAEFALESWNLRGILCVAKLKPRLAGRPEFDEYQVFKSKSRSIPAARPGGNDAG